MHIKVINGVNPPIVPWWDTECDFAPAILTLFTLKKYFWPDLVFATRCLQGIGLRPPIQGNASKIHPLVKGRLLPHFHKSARQSLKQGLLNDRPLVKACTINILIQQTLH